MYLVEIVEVVTLRNTAWVIKIDRGDVDNGYIRKERKKIKYKRFD